MSLLHFSPPAHTNGSNLLVHHVTLRCALAGMHCTNDYYTRRYTCISPLLTVARWTRCSFLCGGPFSCHDYTSTPVQERSTHEETRKATAPTAYKHWLYSVWGLVVCLGFLTFWLGMAVGHAHAFPVRVAARPSLASCWLVRHGLFCLRLSSLPEVPSDPFACSFAALFPGR